ncbi:MAG: peptidoglycan-binding protein [Eubacteriales bacterium]|nr:peptidoglycan-binding protein [Eubacteriales bacterium]
MKRYVAFLLCLALILPLFAIAETWDQDVDENQVVMVSSEARELKYGDKGTEVKQLQTRLKDLKYYSAKVTGNFLTSTQASVKKVQEAYGLPSTGDADSATLEVIYGDCHRPLARGDNGKDVSRAQTRLSELGYYWGQISGNYLDGTSAAIGNFQRDNGLEKTGKADVKTLLRLYSDDVYRVTPDPMATPSPVPAPTALPDLTYPGKLSYGSKGDKVAQLQDRLKELGYFTRKSTAGFYKHTQAAVAAFQKQNGLKDDGVVGEETWTALYSPSAARPFDPAKPTPEPTPIPYALEVDVTNQLIKVYGRDEQGGYSDFLRAMWCSTGTTRYPSDVGTFTITERRARWAEFPNWGGGKAQYWVRITSDIAFHSVIYSAYDTKAVNMKSVNALGKRASHGCIRLTLEDAKWVYQNIGPGVQVTIREDRLEDAELKQAHKPAAYEKRLYAHPVTPAPTMTPQYDAKVPPQGDIRTLKKGSQGEDVFWLQKKLKELGHFANTATGDYQDGTREAVKRYQKANGLKVTGEADKKMLEHLYSQTLLQYATPTPIPTDVPSPVIPSPTPFPAG